jgi:hypothetical protein
MEPDTPFAVKKPFAFKDAQAWKSKEPTHLRVGSDDVHRKVTAQEQVYVMGVEVKVRRGEVCMRLGPGVLQDETGGLFFVPDLEGTHLKQREDEGVVRARQAQVPVVLRVQQRKQLRPGMALKSLRVQERRAQA